MLLRSLSLKNFRCFGEKNITFEAPITIIVGNNGSGKTSVIEALHYACYRRSFRTSIPREMIAFNTDTFFIKLFGESAEQPWTLGCGFSSKKKTLTLNDTTLSSYKELTDYYRIITLIEDDLFIIKGAPEVRRAFLDQALIVIKPTIVPMLRTYRKIVEQRNALLIHTTYDQLSYEIWTKKLWELATTIVQERYSLIKMLEQEASTIFKEFFQEPDPLLLTYNEKRPLTDSFESFIENNKTLEQEERSYKRSLFGPHLDDYTINWHAISSRHYASRGQQKLLVLVLKLALYKLINKPVIFALDDFLADFDHLRLGQVITSLVSLKSHLIITIPVKHPLLIELLNPHNYQVIITD